MAETLAEHQAMERGRNQVVFKAGLEGKPDKPFEILGYLFDAEAKLIATAKVEDGQARFIVDEAVLRRARVFFGPKVPEERLPKTITPANLSRWQAYEPVWKFEPGKKVYELLPIPEALWRWWPWCKCRVRGRVLKRITSGGVSMDLPVCNARVHICEVDRLPWVIIRLPEDSILRLRDDLLRALERPPIPLPEPEPDPPFPIDPGVIDPIPETPRAVRVAQLAQLFGRRRLETITLNPQPEPPAPLGVRAIAPRKLAALPSAVSATTGVSQLGPQPEPPDLPAASLSLAHRDALLSNAIPVVRKALLESVEIIRAYICWWRWLWPYFYDCDEVAVVLTDTHGRFDTEVWYPCFGDHPDLYFWVEYSIGGTWETVYHPSIRCHTHWDYPCGSEVTIYVTDPRVPGCGEVPTVIGKKVVVKSIGRQVSMGEIYRQSEDAARDGTVKPGWIHGTKESPFGAIVEPRVDFGNGLKPAGITHYRWSYRTLGSISEDDWKVIDAPVSRHYRETTPPGDPVVYKSVQIGPAAGITGYYVEIEPALPPGAEDWEVLDEGYDLASAYLDTRLLPPGKYELKLELFKIVGATMQRVDLTAETVELYEITSPAPFTGGVITTTAPTAERKIVQAVGGVMHEVAYRLVVHADNRVCFGTIEPVTVSPGLTDTKCGFLQYQPGAAATLSFRASHPADFAWFDFDAVRVSTPLPSASAWGLVEAVWVNGFSRAGDTFSKAVPVSTLFSENLPPADMPPCTRAAFAESLWVYALATDGYQRLHYLDAPRADDPTQIRLRGFALTPAGT